MTETKITTQIDGIVYLLSTLNNTILSIIKGKKIMRFSTGTCGFKGSKRSTPFAAYITGKKAGEESVEKGLNTIILYVKGFGKGRESAIKGLKKGGLFIKKIIDNTPIPHNGCRPPKRRRL